MKPPTPIRKRKEEDLPFMKPFVKQAEDFYEEIMKQTKKIKKHSSPKPQSTKRVGKKTLNDFKPNYTCWEHPFEGWHEVGCPHRAWGNDKLQEALNMAKQSNAYLSYLAFGIDQI